MFCFSYVKWVSLKVTDTKTKLLIVSQSGKCSQQKWNMCVCSLVLWQHEQLDSRQSGQMLWSTYGRHFPLFLPTGKLLVNERDEVLDGEKCRLNAHRTAEGGPVSQPATFTSFLTLLNSRDIWKWRLKDTDCPKKPVKMFLLRWSLRRKWKDRKKWGQQMSKKIRIDPYKMEIKMNFQLNVGMKQKIYIHTNFLRWSALIV